MAHSCVSFQRFNSLVFSSSNSSSTCSSHPKFLSIPFDPRCSRKSNQKNLRSVSVKAVFSGGFLEEFVASDSVHKVGDDLQIPSSPYFPAYAQGQGQPPMVQEPFQSVISQLFQHRIIRCGGAVDNDVANIIVAQLLFLDAVDPKKDIVMYVNSPGGSVTAGMAIFDTMRHIRPDVSIVCVGLAARLCHGRGNNTLEKTNQDTDRDFFMSAKEAKEYGLIDGVIMNPLKALQPLAATASP